MSIPELASTRIGRMRWARTVSPMRPRPTISIPVPPSSWISALLPRVAIHRANTVIGKDTVPAMQSGLYWGYVGLIEGLVARIKAERGTPMRVIATGGLAHLFERDISAIEQI